jgi:hypothetical protein
MVFSLEHDIKVTKNHQNLLPTQSVLVAHTVFTSLIVYKCACVSQKLVSSLLRNEELPIENNVLLQDNNIYVND